MMRAAALLVMLCAFTACVSQTSRVYEVGRREATRLRDVHTHWLTERPRKFDYMGVSSDMLSKEARAAGFRGGSVSAQIVMLSTWSQDLVFGPLTTADIEGLKFLGYTLESTSESDIFRYHFKANPQLIH